MKNKIISIISLMLLTAFNSAFAATTTGNFNSNASLNPTCTILSTPDFSFGTVQLGSTVTNVKGPLITVQCSKTLPWTMSVTDNMVGPVITSSWGIDSGPINSNRQMCSSTSGNSDCVPYVLKAGPNSVQAGSHLFGDNNIGSPVTKTGNSLSQIISLWLSLDTSYLTVTPDNYLDTVHLLLTY